VIPDPRRSSFCLDVLPEEEIDGLDGRKRDSDSDLGPLLFKEMDLDRSAGGGTDGVSSSDKTSVSRSNEESRDRRGFLRESTDSDSLA